MKTVVEMLLAWQRDHGEPWRDKLKAFAESGHSIGHAAEQMGIPEYRLRSFLKRRGVQLPWVLSDDRPKNHPKVYSLRGHTGTLPKLAKVFSVNETTVRSRLHRGLSLEEAFMLIPEITGTRIKAIPLKTSSKSLTDTGGFVTGFEVGCYTWVNSSCVLPPVNCPLMIEVGSVLIPARRTGFIPRKSDDMEYLLDNGERITGRFRWTYP